MKISVDPNPTNPGRQQRDALVLSRVAQLRQQRANIGTQPEHEQCRTADQVFGFWIDTVDGRYDPERSRTWRAPDGHNGAVHREGRRPTPDLISSGNDDCDPGWHRHRISGQQCLCPTVGHRPLAMPRFGCHGDAHRSVI